MKILLVGTQMATGGAQKVLLDQAHWFHEHGHQVKAVFFYDKENLHKTWQANSDFRIVNLEAFQQGAGTLENIRTLLRGLARLWRLLREETPQVVEAFTHDSNMLVLPLAWLAGIPLRIATHHGVIDGFPRWRERIHAWMVNHWSHGIVAVSDLTRKKSLQEGILAKRITVITNGIKPIEMGESERLAWRREIRAAAGFAEQDVVLLSVGRLVYQKAHEVLVAAMPEVLNEMKNVKAGICGDGVLRADLEKQIQALGLEEHVTLFGMQSHVAHYLAAADVFVLPSRWEGLPIALLEAMSMGLPVIATRVEGVEEAVQPGVHGLLIPLETPGELAKAILQLSAAPETRLAMGQAARARILDMYTVDTMCRNYLDVFEHGLSVGNTPRAETGSGGV